MYSCSRSLNPQSIQPDILLIMPDQMRGDCLSVLNHPVIRTPTMDSLARNGVLFRRAYTTVSSCIPARYSLLTGLFPQTSGVVGYGAKPFSTPSLPSLLAESGYETVLIGRNMHQVPGSGNCGYQKQILGSTYVENDEYDGYFRRHAPEYGSIKQFVDSIGLSYNHWQARPWPLAENLHPTSWCVEQSRKVIAETEADKPLFLTASFYAPHPPLFPPQDYYRYYMNSRLPSVAQGDWVNWASLTRKGSKNGHRIMLSGDTLRSAQSGYFGLIEHLDARISELISDFKTRSRKAARAWLIVITSDHGEMLGDHGYFRKCEPYEGSANIPLIISGSPDLGLIAGSVSHQPVCLEDIMPTLLNLAGVQLPEVADGIDLLPVLRGEKEKTRPWLHFEHAPCYSEQQAYQALTDGCFKYIWRPLDGREQLFNLEDDPGEKTDLTNDDRYASVLAAWRSRLIERLKDRPEGFVSEGKLVSGRPYKALNKGMLIG
ncbi:hypothetical protein BVY01_01095 [bacterium I07]|nr:hypothetical protein BVY01_01095 [bacterium I07]